MRVSIQKYRYTYTKFSGVSRDFLLALTLTSPSLFPCCCLISVSTAARAGRGIWLEKRDFVTLVVIWVPGDRRALEQPVWWAESSWLEMLTVGNIWNQKLSPNNCLRMVLLSCDLYPRETLLILNKDWHIFRDFLITVLLLEVSEYFFLLLFGPA